MNQQVLNFLTKQRTGVFSVNLPGGLPHAATVHFSHRAEPFKIFIQTSNTTNKVKSLLAGEEQDAAMIFGFSEQEWITVQMRGKARIIKEASELEAVYKIHYAKNPEAEQYKGPKTVFIEFTPIWWRYTDLNTEPETIIES